MIKIIVDAGSKHNNELDRAYHLIEQSAKAGCYGIKFQLFKAEKLYSTSLITDEIRSNELNPEWIPKLSECCKRNKIKFGITPFHLEAVDQAASFVDFFKISSFDILRKDLINKCFMNGKLLMLSLGLAEKNDIYNAFNWLYWDKAQENREVVFMHCVSNYPTRLEDACMERVRDLEKTYSHVIKIGYSDHTKSGVALISAIMNGAEYLEIHCDLDDEQGAEYKHEHCWKMEDIASFNGFINDVNIANKNTFKLNKKQLWTRANPESGLREQL